MPSVEQVMGTMPTGFREKFPTTFAIIDGGIRNISKLLDNEKFVLLRSLSIKFNLNLTRVRKS